LTVSSEIPVAIVALNFRAGDFTAIPLTSLSNPLPVPVQPSNITLASPAAIAVSNPSPNPGFGLGLPPTFVPIPGLTTPVTVLTTPGPTTTSIGGSGSVVFGQIVAGGGWSTDIAIGNTSVGIQQIEVDFFGPDGSQTSTLSNIVIPSRGVFFFSIGGQV